MDGMLRPRRRVKLSGRELSERNRGDKIDGTHEGKIPNTLLLGECPVLLRGMYLIVAHLRVSSRIDYSFRHKTCACIN